MLRREPIAGREKLEPDQTFCDRFRDLREQGYREGRFPLFVLGAGISEGRVPLLEQMAQALLKDIEASNLDSAVRGLLISKGRLIEHGTATRSDAVEFFSTLQLLDSGLVRGRENAGSDVWRSFCQRLLDGGLEVGETKFVGVLHHDGREDSKVQAGPSLAHKQIARLLFRGVCNVLNLNFDPLLYLAMKSMRGSAERIRTH